MLACRGSVPGLRPLGGGKAKFRHFVSCYLLAAGPDSQEDVDTLPLKVANTSPTHVFVHTPSQSSAVFPQNTRRLRGLLSEPAELSGKVSAVLGRRQTPELGTFVRTCGPRTREHP